jgi:hypothetical protein
MIAQFFALPENTAQALEPYDRRGIIPNQTSIDAHPTM